MAKSNALGIVCRAASELQEFCESKEWQFCFIGGLAVIAWALPRTTVDADITLLTGFGGEERYVRELLEAFAGRRSDTTAFALRYRVVLLKSSQGIGLDIGLGALPFEERSVRRSKVVEVVSKVRLRVCCADDLIVHKAFASRDQDWADVDSILMTQGKNLDPKLILEELRPLAGLKEDEKIVPRLEELMRKRGVL